MRKVDVKNIRECVADLCIKANTELSNDVKTSLKKAIRSEKTPLGKDCLKILLENCAIASKKKIAMCQDTGMTVVFLEIGQDVHFTGGDLYKAVNEGVKKGYVAGYLRKSVVDPLSRKNTRDNTPAVIHAKIVPGSKVRITVSPKGFGSENMSAIRMFSPSTDIEAIEDFIVEVVETGGSRPCPPVIVGVGIGGTFEKAALLSKEALLKPANRNNPDIFLGKLEKSLLKKINKLKIGPQGLGGDITALGVRVLKYPTHIAGLPVAVNICCHALRHKETVI